MEELENAVAVVPPPPVPQTLPHMITCASMVPDIARSMSSALKASGSSKFINFLPNLIVDQDTSAEIVQKDDEINAVVGDRNCGDEAESAKQVTLHHSLSLFLRGALPHSLICWLIMHVIRLCFLNACTKVDSS
jgi:hypothetical protein